MAITTTSDLNSLFNNIYEDSWFVTREMSVMRPLVTQRQSAGMAPRIMSSVAEITPVTISEGGTPTANNFSRTNQGTISPTIKYAGYIITDEAIATDWQDLQEDAAFEAGGALAQQLDTVLVGLFSNFGGTVGAGGAVSTLAQAQQAMAILANNAVVGQRNAVLGAGQWNEISKALTQSGNASFAGLYGDVGNEAMRNYFVSNWSNARWYTNANIGTTGTAGTATAGIFTQRAIMLDERTVRGSNPLDFETHRLEHGGGYRANWRLRYGASVRRANHGVAWQSHNAIVE